MARALVNLARDGFGLATTMAGQGVRLAKGAAEQVVGRVLEATGDGGRSAGPEGAQEEPGWPADRHAAPTDTPTARPGPPPPTAAEAVAAEQAEPRAWERDAAEPGPRDPSLEHVSEQATLAAESSDPGAEEGAGPEVTVAPPWPGYEDMRARDIVDRLNAVGADVAATVRLYEASTKGRKTVLDAATRATRA